MSITKRFLMKLLSISIIAIFSISMLIAGFTNLQPKQANAFDFNKFLDKCSGYNHYSSYSSTQCDILSQSVTCLVDNCSDGINPDTTVQNCASGYYRSNSRQCLSLYASAPYLNCYNSGYYNYPCNTSYYPVYTNNYNYNTCVNCFEQAVSQLQNGVNGYSQGNANIDSNLLNEISNSGRSDIPTSVYSYVSGNSTYIEVKNYGGSVLTSSSFSIDDRGVTTVNNSSSTYFSPNCNQNLNLYICDSLFTAQIANQFGSYGSISVPFRSTFTIAPTQNNNNYYSNIAYNYPSIIYDYPIYTDYYYGYEDCNNALFGCEY
jgi:hypothetical protein